MSGGGRGIPESESVLSDYLDDPAALACCGCRGPQPEGIGGVRRQADAGRVLPPGSDRAAELAGRMHWTQRALCAQTDPEAFFPEKGGTTRDAKRICGGCEVRSECLDSALQNNERYGIWGGRSERERRQLVRDAT